jgi:type I restriction-modification system DNA methylase subunit
MNFQTPIEIAQYMCTMIPENTRTILEPTPGEGHIVQCLNGYDVTAPEDFFKLEKQRFDCIIMNPPFSSKYTFGIPDKANQDGLRMGYHILNECMKMSDHVIALMPWFTISDSDVRLRHLKRFGLRSITALPRKTFFYSRIQTIILELQKGWKDDTVFEIYEFKTKQLTF